MSYKRIDRVHGTLSVRVADHQVDYAVLLDLEVVEHSIVIGIYAIPRVRLASGFVPDGSGYTLRYAYRGERHEQSGLQVQFGHLMAA